MTTDDVPIPSPTKFLRPHATADALQFDGTRQSAVALARAFPGCLALAVEHDDELLALAIDALGHFGLHRVPRGSWLVRGSSFGERLQLLREDHFRAVYVLDTRE